MKVFELYDAVSKLGFEDSLEDNKAFYHALNRATVQVNALRPRTSVLEIFHKPLDNRIGNHSFAVREVFKNTEFFAEGAMGYYFEVLGEGRYNITYEKDGNVIKVCGENFKTSAFTALYDLIKDEDGKFIEGEIKLSFESDYVFYIRNVALYDRLLGSDKEDIPAFSEYSAYDISSLRGDFLALEERPISMDGHVTLNSEYEIEDGRVILLHYNSPGVYKIRYKKRVPFIEYSTQPEEDETNIELDEELCTLLPLLIASYVWIEDEPDKAQYYLSLYTSRAKEVAENNEKLGSLKYETNGW